MTISLPPGDLAFLTGVAVELAAIKPKDTRKPTVRRSNLSQAVRALIERERKRRTRDGHVVFEMARLAGGMTVIRRLNVETGELGEMEVGPWARPKK